MPTDRSPHISLTTPDATRIYCTWYMLYGIKCKHAGVVTKG